MSATKGKQAKKPVRAWAYVNKADGEVVAWSKSCRDHLRSRLPAVRQEFGGNWRIARVEIREVGQMNATAAMHVRSTIAAMGKADTNCEAAVMGVAAWGRGGLHALHLAGLIAKSEYDDGVRQINEAQGAILGVMADIRRDHARAVA